MIDSTNIWYLEEVNLFECFCPISQAEDRYEKQPKRSFKKGEFIYFSEDQADKVYFIHEGAVKIGSYTSDGNELIKAVLRAGEVFGEMSVFGEEKRTDFAQAVEPTELCVLSKNEVVGLMRDVGGFQAFLNKLMGQRVVYTQKRLESLLFKDARTRIAEYVLEQAERHGRKALDGAVSLRNYLTHQEIANFTGTSRQTVTTILNEFREAGLLDFDRRRMVVRDLSGLQGQGKG
jgi:CRP/FNR family transcriptional regulator, cyclic AMP receptor protein